MRLPGISPGCSERERVRGAITTRCFRVVGPICTGVKSLRSASLAMRFSRGMWGPWTRTPQSPAPELDGVLGKIGTNESVERQWVRAEKEGHDLSCPSVEDADF